MSVRMSVSVSEVCRVCGLVGGELVRDGLDGRRRKKPIHPGCMEDEILRAVRQRTRVLAELNGIRRPGAAMRDYHGGGSAE